MIAISGVNHSGKCFDFTLLFCIGANSFKCFIIRDDQVLKSSSMLSSSATNVLRSFVGSRRTEFSSTFLKQRYEVVICLCLGISYFIFLVKKIG